MVRAYVLVECETGQIAQASEALKKLEGVLQADATLGPYDVVLLAEKPDLQVMSNFVTDQVQRVAGVKRTTTCLSSRLG